MSPLRERREAVVRRHMESENSHQFDVTLSTFKHPRYELVATGEVYDGEEAVKAYYATSRETFPEGIVCARVYFDSATILRQLGLA